MKHYTDSEVAQLVIKYFPEIERPLAGGLSGDFRALLGRTEVRTLIDSGKIQLDDLLQKEPNKVAGMPEHVIAVFDNKQVPQLIQLAQLQDAMQEPDPASALLKRAPSLASVNGNIMAFAAPLTHYFFWVRKSHSEIRPFVMSPWQVIYHYHHPEQRQKFEEILKDRYELSRSLRELYNAVYSFETAKITGNARLERTQGIFIFEWLGAIMRDLPKPSEQQPSFSLGHTSLQMDILQQTAEDYFRHLFASEKKLITNIWFSEKVSGRKQGRIMEITYHELGTVNAKTCCYFIKNHSNEAEHVNTRLSGKLDPKELCVYRILQYLHRGPKVHFLVDRTPPGDVFIATQDLAFTKQLDKERQFFTYSSYKDTPSDPEKPQFMPETRAQVLQMFFTINILQLIFQLSDILKIPDNFGYVTTKNKDKAYEKWKIVDLQIKTLKDIRQEHNDYMGKINSYYLPSIFTIFMERVRRAAYNGMPKSVNGFTDQQCMEFAACVITELAQGQLNQAQTEHKFNLLNAVSQAQVDIILFLQQHAAFLELDFDTESKAITDYCRDTMENFKMFHRQLCERIPSLSPIPTKVVVTV
jgi:hypothetical protein